MPGKASLARDTQALCWDALASEEVTIIQHVNELLRALHEKCTHSQRIARRRNAPWASPESERYTNVIMLDGPRGCGKTSLLLTMITGWKDPAYLFDDESAEKKHAQSVFEDMNRAVRCLPPCDFDPLPPDLPVFSWIIQAFAPLVRSVTGRTAASDSWDASDSSPSLQERFQKLQETATVGWTTGLLKDALAKDVGEFIVWHAAQQSRWQTLQHDWIVFLDALFDELECADDSAVRINKGTLIVLPIDDLDMQASRVRELLLAVRLLRHERLVYLLTGYEDNLFVALQVELFRDCIRKESTMTPGLRDSVQEESRKLTFGLIDKVIPKSQRFPLNGVPLEKILTWAPRRGTAIGSIVTALFPVSQLANTLEEILKANSARGKDILYRSLQAFHDGWERKEDNLEGFAEFVELLVGNVSDSEEPLNVETTTNPEGASKGVIELSGHLSIIAPAPRDFGSVTANGKSQLHWIRDLDFARWKSEQAEDSERMINFRGAAPPEHTLAIDLASAFRDRIRIFAGPRWADETLGLVWSTFSGPDRDNEMISDSVFVVPWPMIDEPKCATKWSTLVEDWELRLGETQKHRDGRGPEVLLEAWFRFIGKASVPVPRKGLRLEQRLKAAIDGLGKRGAHISTLGVLACYIYGLGEPERKAIVKALGITSRRARELDQLAVSRAYWWPRSNHDLYHLAIRPSEPDARSKNDALTDVCKRWSIAKLTRGTK